MLKRIFLSAALLASSLAGAAAADGNELYLLQDSSGTTGAGNVLRVDQSQADDSRIAGTSFDPTTAAAPELLTPRDWNQAPLEPSRQAGTGNRADVTLQGFGTTVLLSQTGAGTTGNSATILGANGAALAVVQQRGEGNSARLSLDGAATEGAISQLGDGNEGRLTVSGNRAFGTLIQNGNGNVTSLDVTGSDTSVTYILNGNNMASSTGPSVFTNAGQVTITRSR